MLLAQSQARPAPARVPPSFCLPQRQRGGAPAGARGRRGGARPAGGGLCAASRTRTRTPTHARGLAALAGPALLPDSTSGLLEANLQDAICRRASPVPPPHPHFTGRAQRPPRTPHLPGGRGATRRFVRWEAASSKALVLTLNTELIGGCGRAWGGGLALRWQPAGLRRLCHLATHGDLERCPLRKDLGHRCSAGEQVVHTTH